MTNLEKQMYQVLKRLSRLAPTPEGLGGHASLECFYDVARSARTLLVEFDSHPKATHA